MLQYSAPTLIICFKEEWRQNRKEKAQNLIVLFHAEKVLQIKAHDYVLLPAGREYARNLSAEN